MEPKNGGLDVRILWCPLKVSGKHPKVGLLPAKRPSAQFRFVQRESIGCEGHVIECHTASLSDPPAPSVYQCIAVGQHLEFVSFVWNSPRIPANLFFPALIGSVVVNCWHVFGSTSPYSLWFLSLLLYPWLRFCWEPL